MEQNARSLAALEELLIARQSLAKLLGFESYADMQVREGELKFFFLSFFVLDF